MARTRADRSQGRVGLILAVVVAMGTLVVGSRSAVERRSAPLLTADIQAPVADFVGTPFRALETSLATAEDRRRALEENKALRRELTSLRRENDRLQAMRARLARLEGTLELRVNGDIPSERITARVVSDPGSPFVRSLLLAVGSRDGVAEGHAVLSDAGLVGHVVSAGQRSARVLRLDDLNSRVAVMSERSGARAILVGANNEAPSLRFASDATQWEAGDRVLTSGDDGRLPQGLPVGTLREGGRVALDFTTAPTDWVVVIPYIAPAKADDVEAHADGEG